MKRILALILSIAVINTYSYAVCAEENPAILPDENISEETGNNEEVKRIMFEADFDDIEADSEKNITSLKPEELSLVNIGSEASGTYGTARIVASDIEGKGNALQLRADEGGGRQPSLQISGLDFSKEIQAEIIFKLEGELPNYFYTQYKINSSTWAGSAQYNLKTVVSKDVWYRLVIRPSDNTEEKKITFNYFLYNLDGDLINSFDTSYAYGTMQLNDSLIQFQIQNGAGNTTRTVLIDDIKIAALKKPQITLTGGDIMLKSGEKYTEPGYSASDIVDGNITKDVIVTSNVDVNVPGTYEIKYDVTAADGTAAETQIRTVIVKEKNIFEGMGIKGESVTEDYPAANAVDGNQATVWRPGSDKTSAELIIAFNEETVIDRMLISEEIKNISGYEVSYSTNGNTWTDFNIVETELRGDRLISFDAEAVKYIRLRVTDANITDGIGISIAEIEGYADGTSIVKYDKEWLDIGVSAGSYVTKDIVLKNTGKYGSSVSWKSSDTEAILDNGTLLQPPSERSVIITAELSCYAASDTKEFPAVRVAAKKTVSQGGSSSGGTTARKTSVLNKGSIIPAADINHSLVPTDKNKDADTENMFIDVSDSHWAKDYIYKLADKGIIDTAERFYPERSITREEFVKMLVLSLGEDPENVQTNFRDVPSDAWYAPYVAAAHEKGWVNGLTDSEFGTGIHITRQDAAVMIARALSLSGGIDGDIDFTDNMQIADYAAESVILMHKHGFIDGNPDGSFNPDGLLTRSQTAKILSKLV